MHQDFVKRGAMTTRINKVSETLVNENKDKTIGQSNGEIPSTHHSHRKYKLSHSQISKISKQSIEGSRLNKLREQLILNKPQNMAIKLQTSENKHISSVNYKIKNESTIKLPSQCELHIQIISFYLKSYIEQTAEYQQNHSSELLNKKQTKDVISFEVYDQVQNVHYRSQFIYETLGSQLQFMFDSVQQVFDHIRNLQSTNFIVFEANTFCLKFSIFIQSNYKESESITRMKQKKFKLSLLPFAVIEVVEDHHIEDEEKMQLKNKIQQINHQLSMCKHQIETLKKDNQKLKQLLKQEESQIIKQKSQRQFLLQSYEKASKQSQIQKQFFFQLVPDPKAKNISNFTLKNQIIKKIKNDLKWDQLSSQAPLPQSGRHYFSFNIKNFTPDFMFGIVTLKGKDTLNAFLGLQTICLYASKSISHIYSRGQRYKISSSLKRGDSLFVIVDRDKSMIQWIKRRSPLLNQQVDSKTIEQRTDRSRKNSIQNLQINSTQRSLNQSNKHNKQRKGSDPITMEGFFGISDEKVDQKVDDKIEQFQFIHSIKIPQEILNHKIYAYLEVYNINEPLKINQRK